jgi:hypothetical protein
VLAQQAVGNFVLPRCQWAFGSQDQMSFVNRRTIPVLLC